MSGRARTTLSLAAGSVVSGLLAYVVFALVTRGLGAEDAAPVSVLWTHWAFAGAALTFPLQHWITSTVVTSGKGVVRRAAPRVALVVCSGAIVLGALAWLARDQLFHSNDPWFPLMISLITVGSALIGVVRGWLGAHERFGAVALSLVAENGLRCLLVAGLLVADVRSPVAHGLSLVAGQLVVVLWPSALRWSRAGTTPVADDARPLSFLTGAGVAQLISQVVLAGGPVLLALSGGSPRDVTAMFGALALFRAPYLLALGSVPQLTLRVAQRTTAGDSAALRALAKRLLLATVVVVLVAAVLGFWVGPALLTLVFGESVDVPAVHSALLAVGCAFAVSNLVLMVTALAQNRPSAVARAWGLATVAGALGFAALRGESAVVATIGCFLVAEVAAQAALWVVTARSVSPPQAPA